MVKSQNNKRTIRSQAPKYLESIDCLDMEKVQRLNGNGLEGIKT